MFIVRRMGKQKLPLDANHGAIEAYNKMHVGVKVPVEWGIGGFKRKWRCIMKRFDYTKPKNLHLFQAIVILTNYLHCHQINFTYKVIRNQNLDPTTQRWVGDY